MLADSPEPTKSESSESLVLYFTFPLPPVAFGCTSCGKGVTPRNVAQLREMLQKLELNCFCFYYLGA